MLAVILAAVTLGFCLRFIGRKNISRAPVQTMSMPLKVASLLLAISLAALLVESVNLPVRYNQAGFEKQNWFYVIAAIGVFYALQNSVFTHFKKSKP